MSNLYFILSAVGWGWLVIVAVYLAVRLTIMDRPKRGFEVIDGPERGTSSTAADLRDDAP